MSTTWNLAHSHADQARPFLVLDADGSEITRVADADRARLLAAAPALLAALDTIMRSVAGCEREPKWEAARAAIARATGDCQ